MTHHVYIATSLDGYIATENGGLDWLHNLPNPDNSDYGFAQFMSGIDALVMGRNTFDAVLKFEDWPYTKPVFVLSKSLEELPAHLAAKAEIMRGDVRQVVMTLHKRGFMHLYIDGGRTISAFIEHQLIDQLTVTAIPVLLGSGIPLFSKSNQTLQLIHLSTEVLSGGLVKTRYQCAKDS